MISDTAFSIANLIAIIGWIMLIAAPRWRWAMPVAALVAPGLLAALYLALVINSLGEPLPASASFLTLEGVAALMSSKNAILIGWVHYLAFDLVAGAWEARDAKKRGVPHALLVPCLVLTFMAGPAGFLLYLLVRRLFANR